MRSETALKSDTHSQACLCVKEDYSISHHLPQSQEGKDRSTALYN